ncbi:MAG: hypothetical protein EOO08_12785 [Chitinophagaceae bacterium]|nr:MAG: hypothetical protein EOO08_12785 [Chitinophagaceae bacterium]
MIYYNSKNWGRAIFLVNRSDTFRALVPYLLVMIVYATAVVFAERTLLHLPDTSWLRNTPTMHTLLGFAISMLLVFRTNTAYDRWWEGRKLWGTLVNNSRNLALKLQAFLPPGDEKARAFFRQAIPLYAKVLQRHLLKESTQLALDETVHMGLPDLAQAQHMPNKVAESMYKQVNALYRAGTLSGEQLIVINEELRSFTDVCGACERIKNTPIPYSYSAFIKKFIFFYVVTLPFGFTFSLAYYTVPVTTFIFYVLASLELIAEEIEDPFGTDTNDLPMQRMADTIKGNVEAIFE